jgi:hypothetical protein
MVVPAPVAEIKATTTSIFIDGSTESSRGRGREAEIETRLASR